ncbi:hypothetical protein TIFTF001_056779 [Ficus carica]|uniref:Uncharacterized protein n=1 Tax=Ficus carica TaxID=3494 RepID=A0AA88EJD9_FICCA|nr:hypothetical protein TIFTF001_056779 [Ficus carica]
MESEKSNSRSRL